MEDQESNILNPSRHKTQVERVSPGAHMADHKLLIWKSIISRERIMSTVKVTSTISFCCLAQRRISLIIFFSDQRPTLNARWLGKMDGNYEASDGPTPIKAFPHHYDNRQCRNLTSFCGQLPMFLFITSVKWPVKQSCELIGFCASSSVVDWDN